MSEDDPLDGTAALITGASAGIGRETARRLAAEGADVALAARREGRLRELADELESEHGVDAHVAPTDVTDHDAVAATVAATVEAFGRLDTVVANAGIGTDSSLDVEELPVEQYRTVMSVNTDGMFYTARESVPHLRETEGTLVFVGSFAGNYPRPGAPVYAATKWWTRGFALSLAGQVGPDGVGVSLVHPSEVRTEFGREHRDRTNREKYGPDVTAPADVADAVAFAARQEQPDAATEIELYRRDKFEGL